jgi:hypothetical protein
MFKKIQYAYLLKKYIKWGVWRGAVCLSYIYSMHSSLRLNISNPPYGADKVSVNRGGIKDQGRWGSYNVLYHLYCMDLTLQGLDKWKINFGTELFPMYNHTLNRKTT